MKNLLLISMLLVTVVLVSCSGNSNSQKVNENKEDKIKSEASSSLALTFTNEDFYQADGTFDVNKGKDAIVTLAKYHGYNVFPGFREGLWVSDYGTGKFTDLGLAAFMFKNNETDRYMLMDLFLLPKQMLPEHWHLSGDTNPAKLEGWLVRNGKSYIVGQGENNLASFPMIKVPNCHMKGQVETSHVVEGVPGSFTPQDVIFAKHWQFAGEEGAIITEVANVHTDAAVRHNDKAINDYFLGL